MEHRVRIAVAGWVVAVGVASGEAAAAASGAAAGAGADWAGALGIGWAFVAAQVVLALAAIALAVERLVRGRASRIAPRATLEEALAKGAAGDWEGVRAAAEARPGALGELVTFIAEHRFNEVAQVQQAAAGAARRLGDGQLQRGAAVGTLAWAGAAVGGLGTVVGLILAIGGSGAEAGGGAPPAGPFVAALIPAAVALGLALPVGVLQAWVEATGRRRASELSAAADALVGAWFLRPEGAARRRAQEEEAREREALRRAMRARATSSKGGIAAARSSG